MSTEIGTGQSLPFILYKLRLLGHAVALLSVGAVLYELKVHPVLFAGLVFYCVAFPHLAYWYTSRVEKPRAREFQMIGTSAVIWGIYIAVMQFNLVPSALMFAGLHAESNGGWSLYWKALLLYAFGILLGILLVGFGWQPVSSFNVLLASLPGMIIYPFIIGITNYKLSKQLVRQHSKILLESRTDGLSGLMNRDYFDIRAELEFHRCQRGGKASSFVMIDIDHFKKINDTHGHLAGDKIIQQIAALFKEEIRDIDFAARYGGEEFCLCLVDTDAKKATLVAERIRAKVEASVNDYSETGHTISCGIAEFHPYYSNHQKWLHSADKALYRAKKLGRNRVEVASQPAVLKKSFEDSIAS